MPLYEYRCESCGHLFELIRKFSDPPIAECPNCAAGPVVKLLSSPAIQFKGTGWYITDYARKGTDGDKGDKKESPSSKKDPGGSPAAGKPGEAGASTTPPPSAPKD